MEKRRMTIDTQVHNMLIQYTIKSMIHKVHTELLRHIYIHSLKLYGIIDSNYVR